MKLWVINESSKISGRNKVSLNEDLLRLSDSLSHKLSEHLQRVLRLIHWDHVSGIIDPQELEVLVASKLSSSFSVHDPFIVGGFKEVLLTTPFYSLCPGFTTSPIADEVLVSAIY